MPVYVALLRAVNVGGTGKLPMTDLVAMARDAGFRNPETYIASGNLVFESPDSETVVKTILEEKLTAYGGKAVGVMVRSSDEMIALLAANPFADRAPNRTVAIFLDAPPPAHCLDDLVAPDGEEVRAGVREIYVYYGGSMARSRLKLAAAKSGTARNINTISRLARIARERLTR